MDGPQITHGRTVADALAAQGIATDGTPAKKRHKYGAQATEVDGTVFPSKAEAKRYGELKLLRDQGEILELEVHPVFVFRVNGIRIGRYTADFGYHDVQENRYIVEDVKGYIPEAWFRTKQLMKACFDIDVTVIGNPQRKGRKRKR
jgi:hypothetical protein